MLQHESERHYCLWLNRPHFVYPLRTFGMLEIMLWTWVYGHLLEPLYTIPGDRLAEPHSACLVEAGGLDIWLDFRLELSNNFLQGWWCPVCGSLWPRVARVTEKLGSPCGLWLHMGQLSHRGEGKWCLRYLLPPSFPPDTVLEKLNQQPEAPS